MFLSSMTSEELKTEAYHDFLEMKEKLKFAFGNFLKKQNRNGTRSFIHSVVETKTYRTRNHNTWTIRFQDCGHTLAGYMIAYHMAYTTFITKDNRTNYLFIENFDDFVLEVITAHFLQRYKERYLEPHGIDLRGMPMPVYFLVKNEDKRLTYFEPEGWAEADIKDKSFWISNQGLIVSKYAAHTFTYITFLDQENLSRYKATIYEEEKLMRTFAKLDELKERNKLDGEDGLESIDLIMEKQSLYNKVFNTPNAKQIFERYCRRTMKKDDDPEKAVKEMLESWDEMEKQTKEIQIIYEQTNEAKTVNREKVKQLLGK